MLANNEAAKYNRTDMCGSAILSLSLACIAAVQAYAEYSPAEIQQLKVLAEQGAQEAQAKLASAYYTGESVPQDLREAAGQGDAQAKEVLQNLAGE